MTNAARDEKDFRPLSEAGQVRNDMVSWVVDLAQWHRKCPVEIRGRDPRSHTPEWHVIQASRLGDLADFLEALPDDDPLIQSETRQAMREWHDQRIEEWFDYMAKF